MESIAPIRLKISEKLQNPGYFDKFFDERTRDEVAAQLRELRELRTMSQVEFAAASGMKQSAVSRIEQSDYSGWTYKTLLRAAQALRARLKIELIPAEKIIQEYRNREAEQFAAEIEAEATESALVSSSAAVAVFEQREDGLQKTLTRHEKGLRQQDQNIKRQQDQNINHALLAI